MTVLSSFVQRFCISVWLLWLHWNFPRCNFTLKLLLWTSIDLPCMRVWRPNGQLHLHRTFFRHGLFKNFHWAFSFLGQFRIEFEFESLYIFCWTAALLLRQFKILMSSFWQFHMSAVSLKTQNGFQLPVRKVLVPHTLHILVSFWLLMLLLNLNFRFIFINFLRSWRA